MTAVALQNLRSSWKPFNLQVYIWKSDRWGEETSYFSRDSAQQVVILPWPNSTSPSHLIEDLNGHKELGGQEPQVKIREHTNRIQSSVVATLARFPSGDLPAERRVVCPRWPIISCRFSRTVCGAAPSGWRTYPRSSAASWTATTWCARRQVLAWRRWRAGLSSTWPCSSSAASTHCPQKIKISDIGLATEQKLERSEHTCRFEWCWSSGWDREWRATLWSRAGFPGWPRTNKSGSWACPSPTAVSQDCRPSAPVSIARSWRRSTVCRSPCAGMAAASGCTPRCYRPETPSPVIEK